MMFEETTTKDQPRISVIEYLLLLLLLQVLLKWLVQCSVTLCF